MYECMTLYIVNKKKKKKKKKKIIYFCLLQVQVRRDTALEQKTGIPTFSTQVVLGQDMVKIY